MTVELQDDDFSNNLRWDALEFYGTCQVCHERAGFGLEANVDSRSVKHLLFLMVQKMEYGHAHEEQHAQDQEGREDNAGDEENLRTQEGRTGIPRQCQ